MSERASPLPRWQQYWLIEWLRRREGERPGVDPAVELAAWRDAGEPTARLLARARHHLGSAAARLDTVLPRLRALVGGVLLLVAVLAASGAWALLGDASRPINVLWLWLALLGPSLAMLLLWLLSLRSPGTAWAGDLLGRGLSRLPALWPDAAAGPALLGLLRGHAGWRWWLGAASHALWLAALVGALLGVLLALSLRRYDFVWETTILPAGVFEVLVHALGWLPAQFGFAQPDAGVVAASGEAPVATARRLWSSWLLGALLVYGLLPRLLALVVCLWRARRADRTLRLPLALPYYVELGERLAPPSTRLGVTDADGGSADSLQLRHAPRGEGIGWIAIEVPEVPSLPAMPGLRALGLVETRADLLGALKVLESAPLAKLLVVVDAAQSVDRALLRQLVELGAQCAALAVCLHGEDRDGRREVWRSALQGIGLAPARIVDGLDAGARWLGNGGEP